MIVGGSADSISSPDFWFRIQANCDFRDLRKKAKTLTARVTPLSELQAA